MHAARAAGRTAAVAVVAVADHQVAARHALQHVGEVFAAGQRQGFGVDAVGAEGGACRLDGEAGLGFAVDQHRVAMFVAYFGARAVRRGLAFGGGQDARLQLFADRRIERAHAEFKLGRFGYHVVGLAGRQAPDADDGGILDRVDVAPDDALQGQHRGRRRQGRIDRQVRHGAVAALADEADQHLVRGGHEWAGAEIEVPGRHARVVVHGEDRVAWKALEQAFLDHAPGAATTTEFLGGLEDQVKRASGAEAAGGGIARKHLGGAEQHRGMAVVAAGVHLAGNRAGPGQAGGFLDRQGIHVGAQAKAQAVFVAAPAQAADHAGGGQSAGHFVAPGGETLGDQRAGARLFEAELGMAVDGMAPLGHGLGVGRVGEGVA
jgi:hypothetical protein